MRDLFGRCWHRHPLASPRPFAARGASRGLLLAGAVLALQGACAAPTPNPNACPGHQAPRCLTRVLCDYDERRACEVCRCEDAEFAAPDRGPRDQGAPPELLLPQPVR